LVLSNIDLVAGLGEIGTPILKLLSKSSFVVGYDIDPNLMNLKRFKKYEKSPVYFLHICIPFNQKFSSNVMNLNEKFNPKIIVIHSTVSPNTTRKLQEKLKIPIIYSATRGIHKRMLSDLKKYTKFYALEKNAPKKQWASLEFSKLMKKCGVKTKKLSDTITLELAKIVVDTSYYGWLINYAQISNLIAKKHKVDYDEMWSFADEIQKSLGNRPKMFPGFIGGHCVIPNLSLIDEDSFWQIDKINNIYAKKVKNAKSIAKKYVKGKQSYNK
jgi:UDP-N-acetyl-D-mannosaminuronate dehydrogenase